MKKEMNEKEAREILSNPLYDCESYTQSQAESYLEAIEKARDLVETLKLFVGYDCQCFSKKKCDRCVVLEALATWEKEK